VDLRVLKRPLSPIVIWLRPWFPRFRPLLLLSNWLLLSLFLLYSLLLTQDVFVRGFVVVVRLLMLLWLELVSVLSVLSLSKHLVKLISCLFSLCQPHLKRLVCPSFGARLSHWRAHYLCRLTPPGRVDRGVQTLRSLLLLAAVFYWREHPGVPPDRPLGLSLLLRSYTGSFAKIG
jgi:hypothetical protein